MPRNALPHVDDHTTVVEAAPDVLWRALCEVLDRSGARPGATGYARLVGCTDRAATGPRPLAAGSALPGFHVTSALPDRELVLEGGHRFSSYALVFRIERTGRGRSALTAETRAVFPGATGRYDGGTQRAVIAFRKNEFPRPEKLIGWLAAHPTIAKVRPDQKLSFSRTWATRRLLASVRRRAERGPRPTTA